MIIFNIIFLNAAAKNHASKLNIDCIIKLINWKIASILELKVDFHILPSPLFLASNLLPKLTKSIKWMSFLKGLEDVALFEHEVEIKCL